MASYLQLAPEQGGTRFGPFPGGTIQLGSDRGRCQIVLGVPGIAPVHGMVVDNGNGTFTVQPTTRGGMFLVQGGNTWPLESAVTARSGDTIVLGNQAGPRFTLQFEDPRGKPAPPGGWNIGGPTQGSSGGGGGGGVGFPNLGGLPGGNSSRARQIERQGGYGNALANEASRQMRARLIAKTGLGDYYTMYNRFQSGTYFSPRYIITALGSVVVLLGGALVSCLGLLSAWFLGQ
jgi:hypothetical protein